MIATAGALDEISTAEGAIGRYVRGQGLVRDGKTNKALLFVVYRTGTDGPQNGFKLVLIQEHCEVGNVEERVLAAFPEESEAALEGIIALD